ncbi:MAG: pyridoxal phosphate-dependent aminotransferase [Erysipelotrichaceae bacterium]|nr:pyridoxal phosphate-dependent aminotransferase [Erysipelotrichaceae bacterium]
MKYDFTTLVDRSNMGSFKWNGMKRLYPDVPSGIVPFSVADMELKNPPEVIEGLKKYLDEAILGYTGPTDAYYDAVISWMKRRHNWDIKKEWFVTTTGVVTGFQAAIKSVIEPGDGVIILSPVYYPFSSAIKRFDGEVVSVELINKNGEYFIDFDALKTACENPKNKMLLFCSPHNPIGRVWTKEELEQIGELCLKNDVIIVSDEIHHDLVMPGATHTVFATLSKELEDHMIICTSPSKTFNLAGMQTSNILIPNETLREKYVAAINEISKTSLNALGYKACELAYNEAENWLEELLKLIQHNCDVVCKCMRTYFPEVVISPLQGTYLLWLDFRSFNLSKEALEEKMIKEALWFTDEGYLFGDGGIGFERINLACPTWVLEEALLRLRKAFDR